MTFKSSMFRTVSDLNLEIIFYLCRMSSINISEPLGKSDYDDENDLFYFESEHLALRGNKDYSELLKTIAILEAQRAGAIKDIDTIIEIQKSALDDPVSFIEKIKNKDDLGIPCPQRVVEIPVINWSKYDVPIPEEAFKLIDQERITELPKNNIKEVKKPKCDNKYDTFNKPWTSEEQKRLEELLVQFPPEPVELRRYKKIAEALGNRTVKQVTSRVQKYFLKLYKAGLPIPGRIPKMTDKKKSYIHKHQRHNSYLYKPSTFFPDLEVPVYMTENDDEEAVTYQPSENVNTSCITNKGKTELQIKIDLLKKIKIEKEREKQEQIVTHIGFKCDNCNEEPITGSRWHCYDCKHDSVDFCTDCMISQVQNSNNSDSGHPVTHNMQPVHARDTEQEPNPVKLEEPTSDSMSELDSEDSQANSTSSEESSNVHYDKDYVKTFVDNSGTYNYLDPNFLPQ